MKRQRQPHKHSLPFPVASNRSQASAAKKKEERTHIHGLQNVPVLPQGVAGALEQHVQRVHSSVQQELKFVFTPSLLADPQPFRDGHANSEKTQSHSQPSHSSCMQRHSLLRPANEARLTLPRPVRPRCPTRVAYFTKSKMKFDPTSAYTTEGAARWSGSCRSSPFKRQDANAAKSSAFSSGGRRERNAGCREGRVASRPSHLVVYCRGVKSELKPFAIKVQRQGLGQLHLLGCFASALRGSLFDQRLSHRVYRRSG